MNGNMNAKKIMVIALLVLVTAVSITLIAPRAGDPESHRHSIQQTDDKIGGHRALRGCGSGLGDALHSARRYGYAHGE